MTRVFARFARKEGLDERRLGEAIARAERGSVNADLGGGLIKQRVARLGGGRSGGYRTVIAFRRAERSVFLYGFAKNERANIAATELVDLKKLAKLVLSYTEDEIAKAVAEQEFREVPYVDDEKENGR